MKFKPFITERITTITEKGKVISERKEEIILKRCQECGKTDFEARKETSNYLERCDICQQNYCHKHLTHYKEIFHYDRLYPDKTRKYSLALTQYGTHVDVCKSCGEKHKDTITEVINLLKARKEFMNVLDTDLERASRKLFKNRET